jgi:hypothetical protein
LVLDHAEYALLPETLDPAAAAKAQEEPFNYWKVTFGAVRASACPGSLPPVIDL